MLVQIVDEFSARFRIVGHQINREFLLIRKISSLKSVFFKISILDFIQFNILYKSAIRYGNCPIRAKVIMAAGFHQISNQKQYRDYH